MIRPAAPMTSTLAASVFERLGGELWLLVPAFVFSLVAGALIGRVLGVRRSFAATLLTGVFGWIVGVTVALLIAADNTPASENFARNLFLFSLFGAMAAGVWIEFLARPGMIARAQTGLQSVPHPMRSMRRRSRQVRRYAEITRIADAQRARAVDRPGPARRAVHQRGARTDGAPTSRSRWRSVAGCS